MKSLISLWSIMAEELAMWCYTECHADTEYVRRRFEHEGLWFLAITLADFGKAAQSWLDQGFVVPSDVPSFARGRGRLIGLPKFLSGFLGRVFEPSSGILLENPDIDAVFAIRQLTLVFGKIALPQDPSSRGGPDLVVTPERAKLAIQEYLQCEYDVKASDARLDPDYLSDFARIAEMLFGELFAKMDRDVHFGRLVPKHGPGATAEKLTTNGRWNQRTWPARFSRFFPAEEYLVPNPSFGERLQGLDIVEPGAEQPVRVKLVPKTIKTPRIIAIEPAAKMFTQQAILRSFLDALKQDDFLSRVIGIDDQDPNRELAREGSLGGGLATLDLSEASDRVSAQHVWAMLQNYPELHGAVSACRSQSADVPGHGVIRLAKFASMGSALCFPFEAMAFLTLIVFGLEQELGMPLSRDEVVKLLSGRARVFGDDLIVPEEYVFSVILGLETFGYRVNEGKSFWTGKFRESCGRDYYDGVDVSLVRVRTVLPTSRQDVRGVNAAVATRNHAYEHGMWRTAAWLDDYLGKLLRGNFPTVAPTSSLLGRRSFVGDTFGYRFSRISPIDHSPLVRGYRKVDQTPIDTLDGVGALSKYLFQAEHPKATSVTSGALRLAVNAGGDNPPNASIDSEHLERTGRPEHVSIKLGWGSPF